MNARCHYQWQGKHVEVKANATLLFSRAQTEGGEGRTVACLGRLTIDHASLSRRSTVPTPNRDTFNTWALITLLPYTS